MNEMDELLKDAKAERSIGPEGHRGRVYASVEANPEMSGMADYELLEYVLFATIPRGDTKAIAKDLIRTFGSLSAVFHADYSELLRVPGLGKKSAHLLAHILPVVIRAEYSRFEQSTKMSTAQETAKYLYARFLGVNKEMLLMTSLNLNDQVIQTDVIAHGSVDMMMVDIGKILRIADRNGAKKIVLAHNHPGGTLSFSQADIETTARVISGCMLTGLIFIDHQIMSGNRYLSMFGSNMLAQVLEMCKKHCSALTMAVSQEGTWRSAIMKLRESDFSQKSNEYKLQALEMYRSLLSINQTNGERILQELVKEIGRE